MTLLSPLGAAIAELQDDATVHAITTRIRPIEPGAGDAKGAGQYVPFVIVSVLDALPMGRVGVRDVTLGLRCYAASYADAEALALACEAVFLNKVAHVASSRLGVYHSQVVGGWTPDRDPDTQQPLFHGTIHYPTAIAAVPMP